MKVLIVTDMIKDFMREGGTLFCGDLAREIIPYIVAKIQEFRDAGYTIIWNSDNHLPGDEELTRFVEHAMRNTEGAELIDELNDVADDKDVFIIKNTHCGFFETSLPGVLQRINPDEVHYVGVCTSICIMEAVSQSVYRRYNVFVHEQGVADFDQAAHEFALNRMKNIFKVTII